MLSKSPYVFPGEGKCGHLVEPKAGWERVLKKAGLENLRIHDLRRTLASWQAKTGASLLIVGKTLGHRSPQATAVYAHLDLDPVKEAMKTATTAILAAAKQLPDENKLRIPANYDMQLYVVAFAQ